MQFKEVIGQEEIKRKLILSVQENRVPHALLFLGPKGNGKLPLALAFAQYVMCPHRTATDSCGVCPTCQKMQKLIHPDLHFVVPTTTNKSVKSNPESDLFMTEWRDYVTQTKGYADLASWYDFLVVENKQGFISVRDASSLLHKLNMKSYEGQYKIAVIWMAEKMRVDTANKLLKLLEEPPEKTLFILIAEDQEELLATIRSRTSLVKVPGIALEDLQTALAQQLDCTVQEAADAAMVSEGNWIKAVQNVKDAEDQKYYFRTFQQWMRFCFKAVVPELIDFSNKIKDIGRERQKQLLEYGLGIVRNTQLFNNSLAQLVMLPEEEKKFNAGFAPFVKPANIIQIAELLEEALRQIERNGYAPLIFLDVSFKMSKLLRMK